MARPLLRDIALDPDWLPHTYDPGGANLTSVRVSESERSALMFLSDEHFAGNFRKESFPADAISSEVKEAERAPIHFIFHTSFCCSTLLAKALRVQGVSSVLMEPDVLINLANRFIRDDDSANRKRLELVLRLLERPPHPDQTIIVKPTNFANRLADPVLAKRPNSRAILLYSDVSTFLRSLLKRGMWGRIVGRKLFNQLSRWSPLDLGIDADLIIEQTDVQIAALAWLMQIHHFHSIARAFGRERVMFMESSDLLADPGSVLARAQQFFALDLPRQRTDSIAGGPVFSTHSKFSDRDYDSGQREQDHQTVGDAHLEELAMVVQWIEAVAAQVGAPLTPE